MDRLWTPWRFDYVSRLGHAETACVFCGILSEQNDRDNLVVCRGASAFVVLNLFPYTAGHMLIIANRHIPSLRDATGPELQEIMELARRCETALSAEYKPDGFNLGLNLGRAAGAGVDSHLHMHVVPRWVGDGNFLSIVSETRVLPEELHRTWQRLEPHFR